MLIEWEVHVKNRIDAERALDFLEHTEGAGKPVVRHALESIAKRSRAAQAQAQQEEREP